MALEIVRGWGIAFPVALVLLSLVTAEEAVAAAHPHRGVLKPYKGAPPPIEITQADEAKLGSGEAVTKQLEDEKGGRGMVVQDIAAPPEKVWSRILDYPRYSEMVENVKSCTVYEKTEDRIKTRFVIGTAGLSVTYFIDHVYNAEQGYMTWTLDYDRKSEIDDSVGYWYVAPHPRKAGWSRVYYSVDVRIKGWVPGFIQKLVRGQGLRKATGWVKRYSEGGA